MSIIIKKFNNQYYKIDSTTGQITLLTEKEFERYKNSNRYNRFFREQYKKSNNIIKIPNEYIYW